VKSNLGPRPKAIIYEMDPVDVEPVGEVSRIAWGEEIDIDANDLLGHTAKKPSKADQCAAAIIDYLGGEAKPSDEVWAEMERRGYAERTFKRARKLAGIHAYKETFSGRWMMRHEECQRADQEGCNHAGSRQDRLSRQVA